MIDKSFWDALRVKALLDQYVEGFIEYAMTLQDEYNLTDSRMKGIIKMVNAGVLSQLSKEWKKATPITPSFSNLPDGDYVADLKEMKLAESKKTGRLQVETTLEVVDGDQTGQTCKRFDGLADVVNTKLVANETGMGYFKNMCEVIGLDLPENITEWQSYFDAFVANNVTDLYDITVKSNDKYANVYINKVSDFAKGTEEGVEEGTAEETAEEVVEEVAEEVVEEVVEEEMEVVEEQEVVPPARRKPVVVAQPVKKTAVPAKPATQPVRKVAAPVAMPLKKIVALKRK